MKHNCVERHCRDPQETLERLRGALKDYQECVGMTSDRLFEAYYPLHLLRECDFPAPFQVAFHSIISDMTGCWDPDPEGRPTRIGDARNTLSHLKPEEAQQIVASLSHLIEELEVWIPGNA